jgi:hypothetical protein
VVKTSGASGGKCAYRRSIPSAAARVRASGEDFESSFEELRATVSEACASQADWEAKIVAGVRATVDFAVADPAKARAVTVEARRSETGTEPLAREVIAYFVELLGEVAPAEKRIPVSSDQGVVESIALIFRGHLLAGTADQLPEAMPDIAYLALMPYLGHTETRAWARALSLDAGV